MVSNKQYIKKVNEAVKKGLHNRPIKIVYTKNKPTIEGRQGVASHINMVKYDRIAVWRGLAKNAREKRIRERKLSRKLGRKIKVLTREQIIRHELWHIPKPYASEKEVRHKLERRKLPNRLPTRRRS